MKKFIAVFMAACMLLQLSPGFQVQAAENGEGTARTTTEKNVSSQEAALEVEVLSSLLFPYGDNKVTVSISKDGVNVDKQTLSFEGTTKDNAGDSEALKPSKAVARFLAAPGTYTVSAESRGFAAYTQEVTIKAGYIGKIQVYSVNQETGSNPGPGWICPGDVTNDGVLDNSDRDSLLTAIRDSKGSVSGYEIYDLNGDSKVDIADLQALVQGLGEERKLSFTGQLCLPQGAYAGTGTIVTDKAGNTIAGAGLDTLVKEGKMVTLGTKNQAAISKDNPVEMEFTLAGNTAVGSMPEIGGITIQASAETGKDGVISSEITDGMILITYVDNGEEKTLSVPISTAGRISGRAASQRVSVESDGSIVVDLGTQIAVKHVTVKITGTKKNTSLVNIAKVDFVNDMEKRIAAPQLGIPALDNLVPGSNRLSVSWNAQENVNGYEIYVSGPDGEEKQDSQIISVTGTSYTITAINNKELVNKKTYTVKVRSVNGDWKSQWSDARKGTPQVQGLPAKPDYVKTAGGYRSIKVSWKDMDDAGGYMVYYKKKQDSVYQPVVEGFTPVKEGTGMLTGNSYTITGLGDNTEYSIYVISWNEYGWSSPSLASLAVTTVLEEPVLPSYNLINTSNGEGKVSAHIESASIGGSNSKMNGSLLDTGEYSALGLVDNDYGSYWSKADWDDGVSYPSMTKGMFVTLDNDYKMNYLTFAAAGQEASIPLVRIEYWNADTGSADSDRKIAGARLIGKTDVNGSPYYIVKLDEAITARKIHMCLGKIYPDGKEMKVGEIRFYRYDSLDDDIMGLYSDEMHTTLRDDVDAETIKSLKARLEEVDAVSGEKHPLYKELSLELETAQQILEYGSALDVPYEVNNQITPQKDRHLGISGLNAWQPLGKVASAGETLIVYVGHNTKRTGEAADLKLVVTQCHAESSEVSKELALKVGKNEITVPAITGKDFEQGGQLYVVYNGNNAADQYAIRISGAKNIPVLCVYGKTDGERKDAISKYIDELGSYVTSVGNAHNTLHTGTKNEKYSYDEKNCIFNATDIMMGQMMYSLPATQIFAGLGDVPDKVTKLDNALQGMEKAMTLFYQHKGLSNEADSKYGDNALPSQHLNIRYMRMFAGAFMYASGNHIGIEWDSSTIVSSMDGQDGMGWGIAHEIGHNINEKSYEVAEITNNYFAQLITMEKKGTRFKYPEVYKKVTSGAKGRSGDLATDLAMYWQLHLAFDDFEDRKIFDNYNEQFENLFFARVDTYSRNPEKAPQGGLELGSDKEQALMRLACAAAEENILPFFKRWGMEPDAATKEYAAKFGSETTKALYYVNDSARDYRAAHTGEEGTISGQDNIFTASACAGENPGQVDITINSSADSSLILGYEIIRCMTSNGVQEERIAGFKTADNSAETVFTDTTSTINNRVMTYKVKAVDKFLNYSGEVDAGSVKIQTNGLLDKSTWTVETDMVSVDDTVITPDADDPDNGYNSASGEKTVHSIDRIIDNDTVAENAYNGTSGGNAVITLDMHKTEEITSLMYTGSAIPSLDIEISMDGISWTVVKKGYTGISEEGTHTVWFDSVEEDARNNWIGTYDARYVKLTLYKSGDIMINETGLCGPSGDNMEFMDAEEGQAAVGILAADYKYGADNVIPEGSLVFTGTYKGNPAYNIVLLYDTKGNIIGAKNGNVEAGQVILADVPENGSLGETSEGIWIYYIIPENLDKDSIKDIKEVRGELYRVDNAVTLEGERITSDTQIMEMPETLGSITLK